MASLVDTGKVQGRRKLRFNSIDELMRDIDGIAAADQAGTLRHLGNWTPGQILGHVAAWINYGYEGFPLGPPPWFVRIILRMRVKKYIRDGLPAGVRIPRTEHGTFGFEPCNTVNGADRLRRAFTRLQSDEPVKFDSPAFGPMSKEDRIVLNLRHAELHLSFLNY